MGNWWLRAFLVYVVRVLFCCAFGARDLLFRVLANEFYRASGNGVCTLIMMTGFICAAIELVTLALKLKWKPKP